jgi:carbamoyl-phosphate synthase large subunit
MAGADLADLDYEEQIPEQISVKEVVLPFDRLPGSDPRLGPEMKSTGEVMGTADTFGKAYQKAQMCVGKPIPLDGTVYVDLPVAGFGEFFEVLEPEEFESTAAAKQAARAGELDLVLSRDRDLLEVCVEETITYFSTLESAQASLEAIRHADEPLDVAPVDDRRKNGEYWGQPEDRENLRTQIDRLRAVADAGYLDALGTAGRDLATLVDALDTVVETVDRSVLLVASDPGADGELRALRGYLEELGYDPHIASELPRVEGHTHEEATAAYMMLSTFTLLLDRDPSRRLTEYETARAHSNVLARLVPADNERQTTHVVGGHDDDADHIRDFEFESDPAETLDEAVSWAESVVERRRESARDSTPWG